MSRNLERLVQKAKAERPQPVITNALPIVAVNHADVSGRVDRLIAVGKLAEADRPRCIFWFDLKRRHDLSVEQLAILRAQYDIEKEKVPDEDAAYVLTLASTLECVGSPEGKTETGDSL